MFWSISLVIKLCICCSYPILPVFNSLRVCTRRIIDRYLAPRIDVYITSIASLKFSLFCFMLWDYFRSSSLRYQLYTIISEPACSFMRMWMYHMHITYQYISTFFYCSLRLCWMVWGWAGCICSSMDFNAGSSDLGLVLVVGLLVFTVLVGFLRSSILARTRPMAV